MTYDLFEHRHRFAVWAAGRAAQRGLTSVDAFRRALDATDLAGFVRMPSSLRIGPETFDAHHTTWCSRMLKTLHRNGTEGATYGRVAKFVAVYLKTMIVIGPHGDSRLASVIHPPIDRVLLENLCSSKDGLGRLRSWQGVAWTRLDKRRYYALIRDLRAMLAPDEPFWMLERHWTFASDDISPTPD